MKISFSSRRFRDPEYAVRPVGTVTSTVPVVVGGTPFFNSILVAIWSYELRFRRSLARWIHIDEGYNTMVLDLCNLVVEKSHVPTFKWLSAGACSSSILRPLESFLRAFSIISTRTPKTRKSDKILIKLLVVQLSLNSRGFSQSRSYYYVMTSI